MKEKQDILQVLDEGFVELCNVFGLYDEKICQVAERSTFEESCKGKNFLVQLLQNGHFVPFSYPKLTFKIKIPLLVSMYWFGENIKNSTLHPTDAYMPDKLFNGSFAGLIEISEQQYGGNVSEYVDNVSHTHTLYSYWIEKEGENSKDLSICDEQARLLLPTSTYITFEWRCTLLDLLLFLKRNKKVESYELAWYCEILSTFIVRHAPETYAAFVEWSNK